MKKWKIGVIGVGGISQMHIQSYLHNPNVELYAFCDINEKRLQEMGEKYSITRLYTDKDEMLPFLCMPVTHVLHRSETPAYCNASVKKETT